MLSLTTKLAALCYFVPFLGLNMKLDQYIFAVPIFALTNLMKRISRNCSNTSRLLICFASAVLTKMVCLIFSGGPLINFKDKTLIGITSYGEMADKKLRLKFPLIVQIFTNIHYYFDWISEKTGMNLPKCTNF